ncbi:MAG: cytochrome c [Deltaproteobacteria bacterium]|nr:cytochrome c [Deltaproteobacteria bacterium]
MTRSLLTVALLGALVLPGCAEPGGGEEPNGPRLYFDHCASCHSPDGSGSERGPDLGMETAEMETADIIDVVLEGEGLMNPVDLRADEANAIAEYLLETLLDD